MYRVSLLCAAVVMLVVIVAALPDGFLQPEESHHPHSIVRRDEARDIFPCKRCFTIRRNKVTCTSPRCPENWGCDDYSLRCFRLANLTNVRNDDEDN